MKFIQIFVSLYCNILATTTEAAVTNSGVSGSRIIGLKTKTFQLELTIDRFISYNFDCADLDLQNTQSVKYSELEVGEEDFITRLDTNAFSEIKLLEVRCFFKIQFNIFLGTKCKSYSVKFLMKSYFKLFYVKKTILALSYKETDYLHIFMP